MVIFAELVQLSIIVEVAATGRHVLLDPLVCGRRPDVDVEMLLFIPVICSEASVCFSDLMQHVYDDVIEEFQPLQLPTKNEVFASSVSRGQITLFFVPMSFLLTLIPGAVSHFRSTAGYDHGKRLR